MQQTYRYRNIIIKPHWMQFVINELHLLVLISVGFVYAGIDDAVLSTLVFVLSLLFSLCLAYRMVSSSHPSSPTPSSTHASSLIRRVVVLFCVVAILLLVLATLLYCVFKGMST